MKKILLFWKEWNSLIRLFQLLLNQKQKLTKIRWVLHFKNLQKKILHSVLNQMKKQVKQLFQVWANFTLILLLTDFFVNSRLTQTLVNHKLLTVKQSEEMQIKNLNSSVNQVVKVNTDTLKLELHRLKKMQDLY